ncbi:hypothetical protein TVAG_213350 [Trichomonas vaginalis G3]|uniref:Tetraspanin family protein n=1 Tax=Trichomonas vaginalis (strain ATCC PRA-98 / G3) TaxID=412133 RepID=A2EEW0_TRIV3|nr:hypothetical protein TVAGG3_0061750 [Trichomonas vaginalis G3]EAY08826.1 hypothetical protein TVAG_213350 [Trichomonas vaginalis G3]KAI5542060.1 hypothetical protein TVAGG3_0061750 [Trichomonas vaginalis G3]|eukprot:XP_001321049.1 hypothetical protein [Trichomonas vaginalis G3]
MILDAISGLGEMNKGGLPLLMGDFAVFDILFPLSCFALAAIFFGYRFNEISAFPIAATILTTVYTAITWKFSIGYMVDPVGYIASKKSLWYSKELQRDIQRFMNDFQCCGIDLNDTINNPMCNHRDQWSCAQGIALHKGHIYREHAYSLFIKCFLPIATTAILWAVHLTGGIKESNDNDQKKPSESKL